LFNILIQGTDKLHEYVELTKSFLPTSQFRFVTVEELSKTESDIDCVDVTFTFEGDKNRLKRQLYLYLNQQTGKRPPWGIVTGIRPVKLAGELLRTHGSVPKVLKLLTEDYLVDQSKAKQTIEMVFYQHQSVGSPATDSASVYVGIPFCPSRCAYCSFPSYQTTVKEMERYTDALLKEIGAVSLWMKERGWFAESIYIGGGTPTTLPLEQLERLYVALNVSFGGSRLMEFSMEAGRPDTITYENMSQAAKAGVTRVSINPQSMNDFSLQRIGRNHTKEHTRDAFAMAKAAGIGVINADIIAGLPEETTDDFAATLEELLLFAPQNVTVHSLAMKRSARLTEENNNFHHEQADLVAKMLKFSENRLATQGYAPYYLYRQKQMAGSLENVGYCIPGTENIYNIRIMEENQTIIAVGAGGISKAYYPAENRLERIPNVSNYEIYIQRLDEMISRKEKDLFRRFETC
jgi:coproporphyrinogen dehydrogenase HemZ